MRHGGHGVSSARAYACVNHYGADDIFTSRSTGFGHAKGWCLVTRVLEILFNMLLF
jgi:hypothetical protein